MKLAYSQPHTCRNREMIWQPAGRRWYCQVCHREEATFEYRELPDTAPAIEQRRACRPTRTAEARMSMILAIDPGTEQSGWCAFRDGGVESSGVLPNSEMLSAIQRLKTLPAVLAIEMVASYGMPVGREVFETVRWIGRFQQAWREPEKVMLIFRRDVKQYLCGSMKAKDANVWQALIDKLGQVGTKAAPGPLYGVKSHARSALAVAVTAAAVL